MQLILKKARVSFAGSLFEPQIGDNGKPSYNCHLLIPEDSPDVQMIMETMKKVAIEKWKEEGIKTLKGLLASGKVFLHKGEEKPDYEGYEGMRYLSVRSKVRPKLLNKDKTTVTQDQGTLYSGCYVYAILDVYAQDHKTYGKRINCGIGGLMVVAEGAAFGGSVRARDEDFPDIACIDNEVLDDDLSALMDG